MLGQKLGCWVKSQKNLVNTLEGTVLIQSSQNFIRMLTIIIFRSSLKLGHVGSKNRSLDQILEIPCVHSKRHSFDPKFMKLCQNVNHHNIQVKFEIGSG